MASFRERRPGFSRFAFSVACKADLPIPPPVFVLKRQYARVAGMGFGRERSRPGGAPAPMVPWCMIRVFFYWSENGSRTGGEWSQSGLQNCGWRADQVMRERARKPRQRTRG
jgi:hypothetical protein